MIRRVTPRRTTRGRGRIFNRGIKIRRFINSRIKYEPTLTGVSGVNRLIGLIEIRSRDASGMSKVRRAEAPINLARDRSGRPDFPLELNKQLTVGALKGKHALS